MRVFRKKETKKSCCCGENCTTDTMQHAEQKKQESGIKILGSGCAKCVALEKAAHEAVDALAVDYDIQHITDFAQIASYGVMTTPALVLNGKVIAYGKVLTVDEIMNLIEDNK